LIASNGPLNVDFAFEVEQRKAALFIPNRLDPPHVSSRGHDKAQRKRKCPQRRTNGAWFIIVLIDRAWPAAATALKTHSVLYSPAIHKIFTSYSHSIYSVIKAWCRLRLASISACGTNIKNCLSPRTDSQQCVAWQLGIRRKLCYTCLQTKSQTSNGKGRRKCVGGRV